MPSPGQPCRRPLTATPGLSVTQGGTERTGTDGPATAAENQARRHCPPIRSARCAISTTPNRTDCRKPEAPCAFGVDPQGPKRIHAGP